MKKRELCKLAVLVLPLCATAADVTLKPDGSVLVDGSELKPLVALAGWQGAKLGGGYELGKDNLARFWAEDHGEKILDATVSLADIGEGKVRIDYKFAAAASFAAESVGCAMHLPIDKTEGREWRAGTRQGVFDRPKGGGVRIAEGRLSSLAFPIPGSGLSVAFATTNEVRYLIQDSRRWNPVFAVRMGKLDRGSFAKGDVLSFSLVVSAGESLSANYHRPYVIAAGEEWIPIDYHRDIVEGSALDFSQMGFTDAPAGKHGWIRNVGGHFEFENLPGRKQRFYGVNLCGDANFPDHALADALVKRLKRLGYNALRIHHHDAGTVAGSDDGLTLSDANMDRLDYLVAAAIREGIYITTDLFVSRTRVVKWRHIGVDRKGLVDCQLYKALCAVYDPAFDNWAAYARNFLLHENKYTGRRYVDEPALSLISLINEGGFFMGWSRGVRDDERILASWRKWLEAKRARDPSFASGLSADRLPSNFWEGGVYPAIAQWTGELEAKLAARMKAYVRSLGSKALLTNDNCGPHFASLQRASAEYDYIDDHFYVDHPTFPGKPWSVPSVCPNKNPILDGSRLAPSTQAFVRMLDKPFTITEWNFSGPGRYRGVGGILTGAMAAMQDWDGLWRFAYSHGRKGLGDADVRGPGYFDLATDPLSQAGERACLCLFLRGDLKPLTEGFAFWFTEESAAATNMTYHVAPPWRQVAWGARIGSCLSPESAGGLRLVRREEAAEFEAEMKSAAERGPKSLRLDHAKGTFVIDTPRTCGGFATEGPIDAGFLKAEVSGAPATVWVSSLDGAAIPKSRRLLVTHVTDVQGDGAKYTDEAMTTTLRWGVRPLMRNGEAKVAVKMDDPSRCVVYELATTGRRMGTVESGERDGCLVFTASVAGASGARMLYEIACE
ncbi:MAG: hypothetical protein K6G91_14355 [Kiritimatiellae bacterium]|nr:hypothetical protein [Kiritimatiellia bacterium]